MAGFVAHRMWEWLPAARFGESLVLAGLVALLAWPLRRWRRWPWADALAATWLALAVLMGGALPSLAVISMVAGSMALGSFATGRERPVLALLVGFAMLAGVAGWLLPLPVHRSWVYLPLFVFVVAMRREHLHAYAFAARQSWRSAVDASPRAAAWATLTLGVATTASWLPTMQFDDLAYHLGLPWQLMLHGRYALDPTHQVWALAPWAGDVLQAIAQLIARAEARGPLNLVWLVASAAGLWRLGAQAGLSPAMRWAGIALFASLPTLAALLGGMQTELPATAVTVALATLVFAPESGRRELFTGALLLGLLCALKPMHALTAVGLVVCAAWRARTVLARASGWPPVALAMLLVFAVGASSYVHSAAVSGNPLLPLFNSVFQSAYFPSRDFDDPRWHAGFDGDVLWDLTFGTAAYFEGWNGGIGFALVALAGAWWAALSVRQASAIAVCAGFAVLVSLAVLQYARYAFVGIVLVVPATLAALQWFLPARAAIAIIVGLVVANLAYQTNADWMLRTGAVRRSVGALGRDAPVFERYTPERVLAAQIRARGTDAVVLDMSGAKHAEFAGQGRTTAWYSPRFEAARTAADSDSGGGRWATFLREEGITDVMLRPAQLTPAQRAGLARVGAHLRMTVDEAQWWHVPEPATR